MKFLLLVRFFLGRFKFLLIDRTRNRIKSIISKSMWNKNKKKLGLSPPPKFKQRLVKMYAKHFSIDILIETGTFLGDMVIASRHLFKKIYSIEIDKKLYDVAKKRCSKYKNISLFHGNSENILPSILKEINEPCLFWLDAHYSGEGTGKGELDTPIMKELEILSDSSDLNHVILIDDARCFIGRNDYPTIVEVKNFITNKRKDFSFIVKEDVIRIFKMLMII